MFEPENPDFRIPLDRPSAAREFQTLIRLYLGRLKPDSRCASNAFSSSLDRLTTLLPIYTEHFEPQAFQAEVTEIIAAHNGRRERSTPDHPPLILHSMWLLGTAEHWQFRVGDFGDLTLVISVEMRIVYFKFELLTDHGRRLVVKLQRICGPDDTIPTLNASFTKPEPIQYARIVHI